MRSYLRVFVAVVFLCENWPQILANKIFGIPLTHIRLRQGTSFVNLGNKLGKADLSMMSEIWFEQYYNPPFFGINKNDIVFDVGANNGYFTVLAAQAAASGKVYAFEPVPALSNVINKNAGVNNLQNIIVEPLALAGQDGQSDFFVSPSHNGCHSLFRRGTDDSKIQVQTRTLESYCQQHGIGRIDFLKLDCEGAEYEILLGLSPAFLSSVAKISMELHDDITNHTHQELEQFLRARGFFVEVKNWYLYALNPAFLGVENPK